MKSRDVIGNNVEKIAALFPQCVTERLNKQGKPELAIDFDKLRAELSNDILEDGEERYMFTWPNKRNASHLANESVKMTLRPCREESVGKDGTLGAFDSENLYIEGDNLDALKVLQETYLGRVKMIYIDPPYNTGNDFIYYDDFNVNKELEESRNGLFDEEGMQTLSKLERNSTANGRFHTDWLNMIYPRLKVARDLLAEDGVIFISIDDNEVDNLRKISTEIFGSDNLIAEMIVNRTSEVATNLTVQKHEYCLVYAKNISLIELSGDKKTTISRGTVGNENQTMPIIEFPAGLRCVDVPDGFYTEARQISGSRENIELITPMTIQNGCLAEPVKLKARWRSSNDMRNFFANNCNPTVAKINGIIEEIYIEGTRLVPQIKKSVTEKIPTVYLDNKRGSKDLERLDLNFFDFPKSVDFVSFLVKLFTKENDIVLDFFSGSATTAQSVMSLNSIDGKERRFILVQIPEKIDVNTNDKKGERQHYSTICELAEERIRRAGKKIREEAGDKAKDLDTGFRVLKLDSSNMEDVFYSPDNFDPSIIDGLVDNIKPDRTPEDLLFQVMLDLGIELSAKIEEKEIAGKKVFSVDDDYLLACFDKDVNETTIEEMAKLLPTHLVIRDASAANDNVLDNFDQIIESYSAEKKITTHIL